MGNEYITQPQIFLAPLRGEFVTSPPYNQQQHLITTFQAWTTTCGTDNATLFKIPNNWVIVNEPTNYIINVGGIVQSPDTYTINRDVRTVNFLTPVPKDVPMSLVQLATHAPSSNVYDFLKINNANYLNTPLSSITVQNGLHLFNNTNINTITVTNAIVQSLTSVNVRIGVADIINAGPGLSADGQLTVYGSLTSNYITVNYFDSFESYIPNLSGSRTFFNSGTAVQDENNIIRALFATNYYVNNVTNLTASGVTVSANNLFIRPLNDIYQVFGGNTINVYSSNVVLPSADTIQVSIGANEYHLNSLLVEPSISATEVYAEEFLSTDTLFLSGRYNYVPSYKFLLSADQGIVTDQTRILAFSGNKINLNVGYYKLDFKLFVNSRQPVNYYVHLSGNKNFQMTSGNTFYLVQSADGNFNQITQSGNAGGATLGGTFTDVPNIRDRFHTLATVTNSVSSAKTNINGDLSFYINEPTELNLLLESGTGGVNKLLQLGRFSSFNLYPTLIQYENDDLYQAVWPTPGIYYFTVPEGVQYIAGVAVGAGGSSGVGTGGSSQYNARDGGGGGGLIFGNYIPVTPGEIFEIRVGRGGQFSNNVSVPGERGGSSYIKSLTTGVTLSANGGGGGWNPAFGTNESLIARSPGSIAFFNPLALPEIQLGGMYGGLGGLSPGTVVFELSGAGGGGAGGFILLEDVVPVPSTQRHIPNGRTGGFSQTSLNRNDSTLEMDGVQVIGCGGGGGAVYGQGSTGLFSNHPGIGGWGSNYYNTYTTNSLFRALRTNYGEGMPGGPYSNPGPSGSGRRAGGGGGAVLPTTLITSTSGLSGETTTNKGGDGGFPGGGAGSCSSDSGAVSFTSKGGDGCALIVWKKHNILEFQPQFPHYIEPSNRAFGQIQQTQLTSDYVDYSMYYPTFTKNYATNEVLNHGVGSSLTFTRPSLATIFTSTGILSTVSNNAPRFEYGNFRTNLISRSETFSLPALWALSGVTVVPNITASPSGFQNASEIMELSVPGSHTISYVRTPPLERNTYTFSVFAKQADRRYVYLRSFDQNSFAYTVFDLLTGGITELSANGAIVHGGSTINYIGDDWYRISLTTHNSIGNIGINPSPTPAITPDLSGNITYTGTLSAGIFVWGSQLERALTSTTYTYTSTALLSSPTTAGSLKGLLIEKPTTNLFFPSETLTAHNSFIGGTGVSAADPILTPYGTTSQVMYVTGGERFFNFSGSSINFGPNAKYIGFSFFIRPRVAVTNASWLTQPIQFYQQTTSPVVSTLYTFNLTGNNPDTEWVKNVNRRSLANDWYRFTCLLSAQPSGTHAFTSGSRFDIEGQLASNYIWGIQVELSSTCTSYISTGSTINSRAGDLVVLTGRNFTNIYNPFEGSLFVEYTDIDNSELSEIAGIGGNFENTMYFARNPNTKESSWNVRSGGSTQATFTYSSSANSGKIAGTYKNKNITSSFNGLSSVANTNGNTLLSATRFEIGSSPYLESSDSRYINGYINKVAYWAEQLPQDLVNQITTNSGYRYYRWRINNTRNFANGASFVQASNFVFLSSGIEQDMSQAIAYNPRGSNPAGAGPLSLLDNLSSNTDWIDSNFRNNIGVSDVIFDFETPRVFDGYKWSTGTDTNSVSGDPTVWTVAGSNDEVLWNNLHTITSFNPTLTRNQYIPSLNFNVQSPNIT